MSQRNIQIDQSAIRTTTLNHESFKVRKDNREYTIRQIYSFASLFEDFLRKHFLKNEDDISLAREIAQKWNIVMPEKLASESMSGISVNLASNNTFELRNITIDSEAIGQISFDLLLKAEELTTSPLAVHIIGISII